MIGKACTHLNLDNMGVENNQHFEMLPDELYVKMKPSSTHKPHPVNATPANRLTSVYALHVIPTGGKTLTVIERTTNKLRLQNNADIGMYRWYKVKKKSSLLSFLIFLLASFITAQAC